MIPDFKDLAQIYQQRALESLSEEDLAHAKRYRIAAELEAVLRECLDALMRIEGASMSMYATRSDMTEHMRDIASSAITKIDEVLNEDR